MQTGEEEKYSAKLTTAMLTLALCTWMHLGTRPGGLASSSPSHQEGISPHGRKISSTSARRHLAQSLWLLLCGSLFFVAPKASAEGACIFSKLVTMERV